MMDSISVAAGASALLTLIITRCRCVCTNEKCGIGFTDKSLFGGNDTQLQTASINGVEVIYVHRTGQETVNEDE
jgi:hypothetical protein